MEIKKNEIHVWIINLERNNNQNLKYLWTLLSSDEVLHAQRFYHDGNRNMYIITHGALREILSYYLYQKPNTIEISFTKKNKPYINGHDIQFNLSHSHKLAVIVFGFTTLGVDVEYLKKKFLMN